MSKEITRIGIKWGHTWYKRIPNIFLNNLKFTTDSTFYTFDTDFEKEKIKLTHILKNMAYSIFLLSGGTDSNMKINPASIPFTLYFNDEIDKLIEKENTGLVGEFFVLEIKTLSNLESYIWEY